MKKILIYSILSVLLISCDQIKQYQNYRLDGMWQLKTVQDQYGNIIPVDTIFYSFQRELIFSFTVLENSKVALSPVYGYVDMPSDHQVHVSIDEQAAGDYEFQRFLSLSGWSSADIVFEIKKYNTSDLVLFDQEYEKTYTLKKF